MLLACLCITVCGSFNANAYENNNSAYIDSIDGDDLASELIKSCGTIMGYIDYTDDIDNNARNEIKYFVGNIEQECTKMINSNYATYYISNTYKLLQALRSTLDNFRAEKKISDHVHQELYIIVDRMIRKVSSINRAKHNNINIRDIARLVNGLRYSYDEIIDLISKTPNNDAKNEIKLHLGYIQQVCTGMEQGDYTTHNIHEMDRLLQALKRSVLNSTISGNVYDELIEEINNMMGQINNFKTKYNI